MAVVEKSTCSVLEISLEAFVTDLSEGPRGESQSTGLPLRRDHVLKAALDFVARRRAHSSCPGTLVRDIPSCLLQATSTNRWPSTMPRAADVLGRFASVSKYTSFVSLWWCSSRSTAYSAPNGWKDGVGDAPCREALRPVSCDPANVNSSWDRDAVLIITMALHMCSRHLVRPRSLRHALAPSAPFRHPSAGPICVGGITHKHG